MTAFATIHYMEVYLKQSHNVMLCFKRFELFIKVDEFKFSCPHILEKQTKSIQYFKQYSSTILSHYMNIILTLTGTSSLHPYNKHIL